MKYKILHITLGLAGLLIAANANAAGVIFNTGDETTATIALGLNDEGHLNTSVGNVTVNGGGNTGIAFKFPDGSWRDATSPGCLCEGWGAAANGIGGSANAAIGVSNITSDSFASTASTATTVAHLSSLPDLQITHAYQPSPDNNNLFEAVVTLSNLGVDTLTDVRYTRAMDWDIPLTEFSELVTIQGTATTANLLYSNDDGFASTNPLSGDRSSIACLENSDYVDCGPADHGALFDFGFGDIAAGESLSFSIFYGATATEADALAAMGDIGAELFSFGQPNDSGPAQPQTFIFAFAGVGGTVIIPDPDDNGGNTGGGTVPEPATVLLLGSGFLGMAMGARRRKKVTG